MMDVNITLAWLRLSLTPGIGPTLIGRMIARAGSAVAAVEMKATSLKLIEGIGPATASSIASGLTMSAELARRELDQAAGRGVDVVCVEDDRYPELLRQIHGPPPVLYVRGTLEPRDMMAVAMVGSRRCSIYGREQAERFGSGLAGVGVTVVSGGARGVDTHAHKGAMIPADGRTIVVQGCGIDHVYPPENAELFARVMTRGAVVTEFPIGTPPIAENFPRRNRLISGLSRGVVVVEADSRSGSLITARFAVEEHNRPVFAVPGRIDNPLSAGPHRLIREGAVLIETLSDILDNLGPLPQSAIDPYDHRTPEEFDDEHGRVPEGNLFVTAEPPEASPTSPSRRATRIPGENFVGDSVAPIGVSESQSKVLAAIDDECDVDTIAGRAGLPINEVLRDLTMLSLRGLIQRVDGQRFARRRK